MRKDSAGYPVPDEPEEVVPLPDGEIPITPRFGRVAIQPFSPTPGELREDAFAFRAKVKSSGLTVDSSVYRRGIDLVNALLAFADAREQNP